MGHENKILLLICYYGKFPWYFPYFLHSCMYNLSVDFIIITDNHYKHELPANVSIINMPWGKIKRMIGRRLGLNVQIESPYKLCDFKPAYGFIFPELIKGYDFWGHGDIDVIFGNIRKFITNETLNNHDLVNVRHDVLAGYFTLFKNHPKMNELFRCSKDYKKVFTSPDYYNFDEVNFRFSESLDGISYQYIHSEIESMTRVVKRLDKENYIRAYFDFHVIEGYPGRLTWKKGILTYKNRFEVMLYHMVRFKRACKQTRMKTIPDTFHISPTRIYV